MLRRAEFEGPAPVLFDLIDRRGLGFLAAADLNFMDKWKPPPYLFQRANHEALQRLRSLLLEVHGNLLKSWRKLFDRDGSMRISWEEFRSACAVLVGECTERVRR